MNRRVLLVGLICLAPVHAAYAQGNESYDQSFQNYLETARKVSAASGTPWMGNLFTGLRARNVNDLVTINVIERIAASGQADSNLNKSSNAGNTAAVTPSPQHTTGATPLLQQPSGNKLLTLQKLEQ